MQLIRVYSIQRFSIMSVGDRLGSFSNSALIPLPLPLQHQLILICGWDFHVMSHLTRAHSKTQSSKCSFAPWKQWLKTYRAWKWIFNWYIVYSWFELLWFDSQEVIFGFQHHNRETLHFSSVFTTVQLCLVISLYVSCVNGKPVGIQMGVDRLRWPMF